MKHDKAHLPSETSTDSAREQHISLFGSTFTDLLILGGMVGLGYLGVAITYVNADVSYIYWIVLIPIFAVICIAMEWHRTREPAVRWTTWLRTQTLHWASLLVAVQLTYMLLDAGRIPRTTIGLVILLELAFTTFLYGIHEDWRFVVVGVFLGITYMLMAYLVSYVWILLVIAAITIAVSGVLLARRKQGSSA